MWPFKTSSPPESKASRTQSIVALGQLGRAQWSPRDYAHLASKGYAQNPVVYRCVRMISESVASVPLYIFESGATIDEHPLLQLLRNPNPRQAGQAFFEMLIGHLLISGNAYLEAVQTEDMIAELYALRPDRMRVVPGEQGWPQAYDYMVSGNTIRFRQDEGGVPPILHLSLFHPTNDYYGLAPLEAAAVSLDILNAASAWHKSLLDNSARPSGALVYAPANGATLSREQFERLKEELEQSFSGAANAGRPLLLEGGLDWRAMSLSPHDMDFIETRNSAARDVALAFGVPPMLLGIPGDATYANYQEANRAFWRQTVLPILNRICGSLAHWLKPAFGAIDLRFDADAIEALANDRNGLWDRIARADFLTEDEKREAVGYAPLGGRKSAGFFSRKYRPNQARAPAGTSDGGQWVDEGRSGGSSDSPVARALKPRSLIHLRPDERPIVFPDDSIRAVPSDEEIIGAIGAATAAISPQARTALAALRRLVGASRAEDTEWSLGTHKSAAKWENRMLSRNWNKENITETISKGKKFSAKNNMTGSSATRYEYNGRYVVRDNKTKEILQISNSNFKRPPQR